MSTLKVNNQTFKTVRDRIILIEQKFKLETIGDTRSSPEAAYKLIGCNGGHARRKGKYAML